MPSISHWEGSYHSGRRVLGERVKIAIYNLQSVSYGYSIAKTTNTGDNLSEVF